MSFCGRIKNLSLKHSVHLALCYLSPRYCYVLQCKMWWIKWDFSMIGTANQLAWENRQLAWENLWEKMKRFGRILVIQFMNAICQKILSPIDQIPHSKLEKIEIKSSLVIVYYVWVLSEYSSYLCSLRLDFLYTPVWLYNTWARLLSCRKISLPSLIASTTQYLVCSFSPDSQITIASSFFALV